MIIFNSIQEGLQYLFSDECGNSQVTPVYPNGDLNDPWFYVHEIATCLNYNSNISNMIRGLPDNLVGMYNLHMNLSDGRQQVRQVLIISLPGLMELIGKSRASRAEQFRSWVYGVLIPGLYKHPEIVHQLNKEINDLNAKLDSSIWKVNVYQQETYRLRRNYNNLCNKHNELAEGYKTLQTVNGSISRKYFDLKEDYTALHDAYDELASRVPYDDQDVDYIYTLSV